VGRSRSLGPHRLGRHFLRVHVSFAGLDKPTSGPVYEAGAYGLTIKTGSRRYTALSLNATGGRPHGEVHFYTSAPPRTCAIGHTINYARARMSLTVPASCLGSSPWVRVRFEANFWGHHQFWFDDAFAKGTLRTIDSATNGGQSARIYRQR
jgi:hypothetical protein